MKSSWQPPGGSRQRAAKKTAGAQGSRGAEANGAGVRGGRGEWGAHLLSAPAY
jgi:hypothetical protein